MRWQLIASKSRRAIALATVWGLVLVASVWSGAPSVAALPDAALGWPVLLHAERAGVLLGVVGVVILICWRASDGDLPIRFANVEYESQLASRRAQSVLAQERRIRRLEVLAGVRAELELVDDPDES